jgi:virulence-associated protein VapD
MIQKGTFDFSIQRFRQLANSNFQESYILEKFEIEQKVYDDLKEIYRLSQKYNFELIVFITPSHIEDMKLVQKNQELALKFESIRNNLAAIFAKVHDFSQDEKYNSINQNFYDLVHYRSILGDEMIRSFENSGDYGVLLNGK